MASAAPIERITTVVRLHGAGQVGKGEDVIYSPDDQLEFQRAGSIHSLEGTHTLASFAALLDGIDLLPGGGRFPGSGQYRRWAFESAALDLALRLAGRPFADVVAITPGPVRFVLSMDLSAPEHLERFRTLRARFPEARFKLDADPMWNEGLLAELAASEAVDVVDLKGAYKGTPVDQPGDPDLYRRVVDLLPEVWLEDPDLTPGTRAVLEPVSDRITWDAPIHSADDIIALPYPPRMINIKPSRFGTLAGLLDALDYCRDRGIGLYGGGQFELGLGRGQVQALASVFYPDAPNDVAPVGYNLLDPPEALPSSPLHPKLLETGFGWQA